MKFVVPVWKRTNPILGESEVTVLWEVPDSVEPGLYRLGHRERTSRRGARKLRVCLLTPSTTIARERSMQGVS